jgi:hypothetical protein
VRHSACAVSMQSTCLTRAGGSSLSFLARSNRSIRVRLMHGPARGTLESCSKLRSDMHDRIHTNGAAMHQECCGSECVLGSGA